MMNIEASAMEIEQSNLEENEEDPFLKFADYAKSILSETRSETEEELINAPSWSWIAYRILKTCIAYSSGVTSAILLSELSQAWCEQSRSGALQKQPECITQLKKKHRRGKLPNTVTIDSIYEKKFLSLGSVIEGVVIDAFILPGTNIYMLTLGDIWSSNTIDLYLHRRFYKIAHPNNGILNKGREVFLTGCYLRMAAAAGSSSRPRLLPTEYFIVLLDEDDDNDAMLLGAQFCSDFFSSISLDAVKEGTSYSLYARIEHIGPLEIQGKYASLQRRQITLVDNDGTRLKFLLWGEQILLANLFSVGSMLALDTPFIASPVDSYLETCNEICLEYGSATQLYLVPQILHEEQVCVSLTQNHCQGSRLLSDPSQGPIVSQVTLPCDYQGSIDFSNYPFRSFVVDLRDKMTSISLYGIVTDIKCISEASVSLKIEDTTGAIWAKLHFVSTWSLGRLGIGHTVFVCGLKSSVTPKSGLELSWFENDSGASFVNISWLPALLNSPCLHKLCQLSNLSIQKSGTHVCRVWLDQIEHCHVDTRFAHMLCGHFVDRTSDGDYKCKFCHCICNAEVVRTFHLKITLADETGKVFAWCTGQTAAELLQISPDEFYELPEEEQIMYPSSLELEKFIVAIVNCGRQNDMVNWEVTRAMKCE